jgi:capsular exopolysaccharide synthesis family protein
MIELKTEKSTLERLIADHVMNYVELSNLASVDKKPNALSVIETAHSGKSPIRPRIHLNILLSSGLGLLLAIGIIFLWEFLDDTIKSSEDLSQFPQLNILGTVGRIKGQTDSEKLITHLEHSSPITESYRMIRNKIRFGSIDNPAKSIVITSPEAEEGKSTIAVNLGITMAQANLKTILVDADLRHPVLHQILNVKISSGLADLINSPKIDIGVYLKSTSIENLHVITSGVSSQNHSEQLRSERIAEILKILEKKADVIIIDSPPALLTADTTVLANRADGVILVIRAEKSKGRAIKQTLIDLQVSNAHLVGCIFNQAQKDNNIAMYNKRKQEKNLIQQLKA